MEDARMEEPFVVVPSAEIVLTEGWKRPVAERRARRRSADAMRRQACALVVAIAVLVSGAYAAQKRTTDPGDTAFNRAARDAENRARYKGDWDQFDPLIAWVWMDIRKLQTRTARLVAAVERERPDLRSARREAGRVAKHSHTAGRWLQGNRATRPHSEPQAGPPRDFQLTLGDIATIRDLVREVTVLTGASRLQVDIARHLATLDKLEQVEALARQVEADLRDR